MAMTPELIEYYEKRLLMMGDIGWKQLIEDVNEMIESTNNINSIVDEKQLYFKKGELSIMNWLVTLKDTSQSTYEELQKDDE